MERSGAGGRTVVPATPVLFSDVGSGVAEEIVAPLRYSVPSGVAPGTLTVRAKVPVPFAANVAMVQVTVPPPPAAGVVHVQPAGCDRLTNVVLPGSGSESETPMAGSGPAFPAWIV